LPLKKCDNPTRILPGVNEGCCCLSRGHSKKEGAASALPASGRKLDLGEQLGQMLLEQSVDL